MNNIQELLRITKTMPQLSDLIKNRKENTVLYKSNGNDKIIEAHNLMYNKEVAVAWVELEKGASVPEHEHNESEILILYKGKCKFVWGGDKEKICNIGDPIYFSPKVPHKIDILEDTCMICVSVPSDKGFPNDE